MYFIKYNIIVASTGCTCGRPSGRRSDERRKKRTSRHAASAMATETSIETEACTDVGLSRCDQHIELLDHNTLDTSNQHISHTDLENLISDSFMRPVPASDHIEESLGTCSQPTNSEGHENFGSSSGTVNNVFPSPTDAQLQPAVSVDKTHLDTLLINRLFQFQVGPDHFQ